MEKVMMLLATAKTEPLKLPRGFLKCIQVIIAIFAFATTTSPSSFSEFCVTCPGDPTPDPICTKIDVSYPYRINENTFTVPFCPNNGTEPSEEHPYGDFSSSAQFYVFIGVMTFLYSLAAIGLYVFYDDMYQSNEKIPTYDFIISVVITVLWLISSSAWAQGLTDTKYYSSPEELYMRHVTECQDATRPEGLVCDTKGEANFASTNVSIIFGFLNTFVWGGNLWFLFKETKWFKKTQPSSEVPTPAGMSPAGALGEAPPMGGPQQYNPSPAPQYPAQQQYPPSQQYPPQQQDYQQQQQQPFSDPHGRI